MKRHDIDQKFATLCRFLDLFDVRRIYLDRCALLHQRTDGLCRIQIVIRTDHFFDTRLLIELSADRRTLGTTAAYHDFFHNNVLTVLFSKILYKKLCIV